MDDLRVPGTILLVDDDLALLSSLARFFERKDWSVHTASSGKQGIELFDEANPEIVLLDLVLPDVSGLQVLDVLAGRGATVVLLTGQGEVETAVEAMRRGAENFLTKPIELPHLEAAALNAIEHARLRETTERLARELAESSGGLSLGRSSRMREIERKVALVAQSSSTVLLLGESGTGKGWIARRIHALSPRRHEPFVEVNCAGLSATFLESELFGHERGAFTDARTEKRGLFEVADGGTVFLDEIGDLALEVQPKLLKALEDRTFRRLGGTREIKVDVRLVVATNRPLEAAVDAGRFRVDLYHRLNVFPITLPPLRKRSREDLIELIQATLRDLSGDDPTPRVTPRALDLLLAYRWPGNIRELRNALEWALLHGGDRGKIRPEHLGPGLRGSAPLPPPGERDEIETLEEMERMHIERALRRFEGNRSRTARALGISRTTLYNKIDLYGLADVGQGR